ncbi:hypothetical protein LMG22037_02629 [Paraburkholderia phenoliruptrix]|uniref:Zinc ribbon domain-containing protein n=1 Tax=Paraburkholderia phenoliruptrix TaxID=252970 RepID=A0A6J5AZ49_9BURK|nr:hypothetical protein [Paraburkholderia phenoliruptrix]CAB3684192.1 hypothetical protein LMG22037_02629 [Paraburkholderia phenoliruptrix]
MSTQTLAGHHFPTPCKRCGGALYRQLEHCPYCGAYHPLDDEAPARTALHESRASTLNMSTLHDSFTAPAFSEPDFPGGALHAGLNLAPAGALQTSPSPLVAQDTSLLPLTDTDELAHRVGLRVRHVLIASAAVVAAGLAYVGYALLNESRDVRYGNGEQAAATAQDARTATGTIARYSPDQAADSQLAGVPGKSVGAGSVRNPTQAISATVPIAVAPARPATPQFRDAAQALQAARAAFGVNDLSAAQAALAAAQALQPDSNEAQMLAARLKPLAARRDAALLAAQMCADQQSWPCAREHADEALALDTGSDPAKTILERVIRETGWAPLNPQSTTSTKATRQVANQ